MQEIKNKKNNKAKYRYNFSLNLYIYDISRDSAF